MLVILKVSVNVARGWLDFRNESRKGNKSEVSILSNFLDEKLNIKTRLVITPTFLPDEKISSRMIKHQKLKFGALFRSEFHLLALLLTWRFRLCAFCSQSGKQTIGKQLDHKYHILSISYKNIEWCGCEDRAHFDFCKSGQFPRSHCWWPSVCSSWLTFVIILNGNLSTCLCCLNIGIDSGSWKLGLKFRLNKTSEIIEVSSHQPSVHDSNSLFTVCA